MFHSDYAADIAQNNEPLDLTGFDLSSLIDFLSSMLMIRKSEEKIAIARRDGFIGGPVHLAAGQEAIAVGVSAHLKKTDKVFGAHRSHAHVLALNNDPYGLFCEVLGRSTGLSKGMGGSMHLIDLKNGFYGSVPIVAGTVALAVGAGLAAKLQKTPDVGVAYFGDGAVEEGVVHESLNLASVSNAQTLFVVENNFFSSHMHVSQRQPMAELSRFAVANSIPHKLVDGNDVVSVFKATQSLIENIRKGLNPGFLEAITYRYYGHVDWREDIDVGLSRSIADVKSWKLKDPITRLSQAMIENKVWSDGQQELLIEEINSVVDEAWRRALEDPYPDAIKTLEYVYKSTEKNSD